MSDKKAMDSHDAANVTDAADQLRSMTAELRDHALPLGAAVTEAARSMRAPVAGSSAFGERLPWWRAAVGGGVQLALSVYSLASHGWPDRPLVAFEMIAGLALIGLVLARSGWARAIILGASLFQLGWFGYCELTMAGGTTTSLWSVACLVVTSVMFAPWRRAEMRWPGVALTAIYPAYIAVAWLTVIDLQRFAHGPIDTQIAASATVAVIVAGLGIIVRARWAAVLAAYTAVVSGTAFVMAASVPQGPAYQYASRLDEIVMVTTGLGAVCASLIAAVAWRTARSSLGTLRDVRG